MNIVLEGIDATGKSTLATTISEKLGLHVQRSEGPPRHFHEMNERLERYEQQYPSDTIFDRHPAVSQMIYGQMRSGECEAINPLHIHRFYVSRPLLIYCDPANTNQRLRGHTYNPLVDTARHVKQVQENYIQLLDSYRTWAIAHAFIWYRIGDDQDRITQAVRSIYGASK